MVGLKLKSKAKRKIRIERVHLEEDAGKNIHGTDGYSYVDLNRQGTPLVKSFLKQTCVHQKKRMLI